MKLTKIQFRFLFAIGMIFHFIALILTYYYVDVVDKLREMNPLSYYIGTAFIFLFLIFIMAIIIYLIFYIIIFKYNYNDNFIIFALCLITIIFILDALNDIYYGFFYPYDILTFLLI